MLSVGRAHPRPSLQNESPFHLTGGLPHVSSFGFEVLLRKFFFSDRCAEVVKYFDASQCETIDGGHINLSRAELRQEDPLNLNILLSGGKETNQDSLSNGE